MKLGINDYCALCKRDIVKAGLNFKEKMPNRTANTVGGIPVCIGHIEEAIELNITRVEAERATVTSEAVL